MKLKPGLGAFYTIQSGNRLAHATVPWAYNGPDKDYMSESLT